jgi:YfiH family protein
VIPSPAFLIRPFPEWEDRVRAAFTLRHGGGASSGAYGDLNLGFRAGDDLEKVSANWDIVLNAAGLQGKTLAMPRMVHGDGLADADALPDPADSPSSPRRVEPENADALWSHSSRRVLAVTMADCLTALIFDPALGTIAAVHAGWRGTQAHILEKTLRALADGGRIRAESVLVALGPCLRGGTLEVGEDLGARLEPSFVIRREGRFYFDMPASNRAQALACGIPAANLRDMGGDTLLEPERYFSYRRDGQASGRMSAFISLV